MDNKGRNFLIKDVELNWARLARPVSPFGTEQYELQIATKDKAVAKEWTKEHLKVKEKDGVFTVALKRKAVRANGESNGAIRVVDASKVALSADVVGTIGNGSVGNVIVRQYPYEAMGRKGIATQLEAVQVTKHEIYEGSGGVDFDVEAAGDAGGEAALF